MGPSAFKRLATSLLKKSLRASRWAFILSLNAALLAASRASFFFFAQCECDWVRHKLLILDYCFASYFLNLFWGNFCPPAFRLFRLFPGSYFSISLLSVIRFHGFSIHTSQFTRGNLKASLGLVLFGHVCGLLLGCEPMKGERKFARRICGCTVSCKELLSNR